MQKRGQNSLIALAIILGLLSIAISPDAFAPDSADKDGDRIPDGLDVCPGTDKAGNKTEGSSKSLIVDEYGCSCSQKEKSSCQEEVSEFCKNNTEALPCKKEDITRLACCSEGEVCSADPTDKEAKCQSDSDDDGIGDEIDNCPNIFNPSQSDTDKDGQGDKCDDDIDGDGIKNDKDKDVDGDGILNEYDNDFTGVMEVTDFIKESVNGKSDEEDVEEAEEAKDSKDQEPKKDSFLSKIDFSALSKFQGKIDISLNSILAMAFAFILAISITFFIIFRKKGGNKKVLQNDLSQYITDHLRKGFKIKDIISHLIWYGIDTKSIKEAVRNAGIKDESIFSWINDKDEKAEEDKKEKIKEINLEELMEYIANNEKKGYSQKAIRNYLIANGYDKATVSQAFIQFNEEKDRARGAKAFDSGSQGLRHLTQKELNALHEIIISAENMGLSEEEIKKELLENNWAPEKVTEAFENIFKPEHILRQQLNYLKKRIKKAKERGYSKSKITVRLISNGWIKKVIDMAYDELEKEKK